MRLIRIILLLTALILAFFIYFDKLNPDEITLYYLHGKSLTFSASILIIAAITIGLMIGYGAHVFNLMIHGYKHWRVDRQEKKAKEIASLYRDGVVRLLSGDLKKARALLQKALDRDPQRIDSYLALASLSLQEGDQEAALQLLAKARQIDPKSLEVLFKLATSNEEIGREEEAKETYEAILAIESDNRKAIRSLRELAIRNGDWREALELQKKVLKVAGKTKMDAEKQKMLPLRYEVARLDLEEGKADAARGELQSLAKDAPEFAPARVSLGDALLAMDRGKDAVAIWQEGYRKLGKSIFLARLEDYYMEAEDPASLLTFYRQELAQNADDMLLRLFYGKFCLRLEMIEEAIEQLFTVENSGVESSQLSFLLAEAYRRRDRMDDAIAEYQKALGVDKHLRLGYSCDSCGAKVENWQSRCTSCGNWGTFSLLHRQLFRDARLTEVREIHHGERS
ncbi:MAG: hypothetical protein C0616_04280 [Desulfuromonas sp.]|nr:MAG: hypothetical protein C0616_04280 [Desulfuromonas sp.]